MENKQLTLQSFIASLIKQHKRKFGIFQGYLYLTEKQTYLYTKLFKDVVFKLEKQNVWSDGKFQLHKDGLERPTLMRMSNQLQFEFARPVRGKSFSIISIKGMDVVTIWISNQNHSILDVYGIHFRHLRKDINQIVRERGLTVFP